MKIIWSNSGGEIDSVTASDEVAAVQELIDMVETAGELREGDTITVVADTFVSNADRQADRLTEIVERVHVADPTAVERYKGFVIHAVPTGGFVWDHSSSIHLQIETIRADIDLYVAKVDVAGASREP